jgi:hypothetical protein
MTLGFVTELADLSSQLVEPINQPYGIDPFVKGLCAFLLGICYEFCPISIENEAVSR